MGDESWDILEITPEGWKIISHSEIIFKRFNVTQPATRPAEIGYIDLIWKYCRIKDDEKLLLIVAIISYLIPEIPHPITVIYGREEEQRALHAKS